jgi:pilus assembly protein CpaC
MFIITPRLVKPLRPDYALPTDGHINPLPADLLLRGQLEGQPPAVTDRPGGSGFELK